MLKIKQYFSKTQNILNCIIILNIISIIFKILYPIIIKTVYSGVLINLGGIISIFITTLYFLFVRFNKKIKLSQLNLIYVIILILGLIGNIAKFSQFWNSTSFLREKGYSFIIIQNLISYFKAMIYSVISITYISFITWNKKINTKKNIIKVIPIILIVMNLLSFIFGLISLMQNGNQYFIISIIAYILTLFTSIFTVLYFKQYADYKLGSAKNE